MISKKNFFGKQNVFSFIILFIMVLSRLIPHPQNFTPIIAVAMMSGYFFKNFKHSILVLAFTMILSDIVLGFHNTVLFVYLPLFLIVVFVFILKKDINSKNLFILGFGSSLLFFIISNFGVWLLGNMYEKTINGLINCYFMAIPFYKNTLLSTIIFSYSAYSANCFFQKKYSQRLQILKTVSN